MDSKYDWNILVDNMEMLKGNVIFFVIDGYFLCVFLSLNNEFDWCEGNNLSKDFIDSSVFFIFLFLNL